jgi:glyoxylase-like metal-dependent hydrolase (beta-lactamase superfamily II)
MTGMTPPVADHWFTATPVDETITLITEPHVHPLLRANCWHIRGTERDLLVDAGLGVASLRGALPGLIGEREPVLVLTHAHLDHMGSAHEFTECWAHPAEPVGAAGRGSLNGPTLGRRLGMSPTDSAALPPLLVNALPEPGYQPSRYQLNPAEVTRQLHDGDRIDLGDRALQVLHLPGHSPGSIGLYDKANRTLFAGDVIYDGQLLDQLDGSNIGHYRQTMRRLLATEIDTVHAGHDPSFNGTRLAAIAETYLTSRSGKPR